MNRNAKDRKRGFSLIEVLMAVLVLGLGLLGLGAVLPVVVRQQIAGNDATLGASAMEAAIHTFKSSARLNGSRWDQYVNVGDPANQAERDRQALYLSYRGWFVPTVDVDSRATVLFPRADGMEFIVNPYMREQIQIGDRLFPDDASGEGAPQVVWDVAVRRDQTLQANRGYQVAIFVRRVDPRASTGLTTSLHRAIGDPSAPNRRVPVAVDANGRPTLDGGASGAAVYSVPFTAEVAPVMAGTTLLRNRLAIAPPGSQGAHWGEDYQSERINTPFQDAELAFELISQPGQKIVDNLGNIYTVEGPDPDAPRALHIVKLVNEIPASASFYSGRGGNQTQPPPAGISHVVAVPQVPLAVNVINVR